MRNVGWDGKAGGGERLTKGVSTPPDAPHQHPETPQETLRRASPGSPLVKG
ncbi:hypothetical protein [Synechococcus sp. RS9909]|uniref:hypothetical protein n=2 Tax=unclassified Synechococcus TaxID=2626047 RepID=UPI0013C30DF1|nr:hypothetical protein [Synechococcus sp. RS9909]